MKYKVGDKVKVRTDIANGEVVESENGIKEESFVSEMGEFRGKVVTISKVLEDEDFYHIKEDGLEWFWTASMFESEEEGKAHKLAEILGVEVGEEFKVDGHNSTYKITDKGLVYTDDNAIGVQILHKLLFEGAKIIKGTYKPKKGDVYFRVAGDNHVFSSFWEDDVVDYGNFYTGNCFRSKEEAISNRDNIAEKLKNFYKNA